jgi:hypothetical protein
MTIQNNNQPDDRAGDFRAKPCRTAGEKGREGEAVLRTVARGR